MGLLARLQGEKRTRGTECNISLIYGLISPNFDCGNYFVEWFVSCGFKIISLRARKSPKFSAGWRESWPQGALPHFPMSAVSTTTHLWMWGFLKGPKEYWEHPNTRENMPLRIYCKAPYSQSHKSRRKVKLHHSLSCSVFFFPESFVWKKCCTSFGPWGMECFTLRATLAGTSGSHCLGHQALS